MIIKNKKNSILLFLFCVASQLLLTTAAFADVLDSWKNERAYKPKPVIFLHGFASGRPWDWDIAKNSLNTKYFIKYDNRYGNFLETIDFFDPNGSIDTYTDGRLGWSDKVNDFVDQVIDLKYRPYTDKVNLVCHSMGGLAARWYLAHYTNQKVNKVILIGTPNRGSELATFVNNARKVPLIGWNNILINKFSLYAYTQEFGAELNFFLEVDINGEAVKDLDINFNNGNNFLNVLNDVPQPSNIDFFGVIGKTGYLLNFLLSEKNYWGGDGIVGTTSQLGTGVISYKSTKEIAANHWNEIKIAANENNNLILNFLDSNKPEFTLDSPAEGNTTQINTTSISVKGKVYKEYLPADSKFIINVIKQENNTTQPTQENLLQPSSLWQPNNPDSPVAEFNQTVTFPGEGIYKVTTYIKNPAGLESDKKEFWVKVSLTGAANIIVHCHNPEGKEIGSILGQYSVVIFDGENTIGYGASNITDHEKSLTLKNGIHTIKAEFNGIVKEQNINLIAGETKDIIFIFNRTEFNILSKIIEGFNGSVTLIFSRDFNREENKIIYNEIEGKYIKKYNVNFAGTGNFSINYSISFDGINYRASALSSYSLTEEIPYDTFPDLPYINDYSMIEYNGDSDGSNIFFHQANLIPSQSGFSNWYTQSITSGSFYPRFRVLNSGSDSIGVIINGGSDSMLGYSVNSFSANISYDTLSGGGGFGMGPSSFVIIGPGEKSNNFEITGTLSGLKMSSVPYDFTGDAF